MPIYEFVCLECGTEFEQLMSFSDHGHPPCPACAAQHVSRKLGRPAIHFKGSGWYVTDSKGSKQSANGDGRAGDKAADGAEKPADKADKADKPAEKGGEKAAEKSDSKPAAAAPAKTESSAPA